MYSTCVLVGSSTVKEVCSQGPESLGGNLAYTIMDNDMKDLHLSTAISLSASEKDDCHICMQEIDIHMI